MTGWDWCMAVVAPTEAVWVTCPSCGGGWCRTHARHVDQCVCPSSPTKRRVPWLSTKGTDQTVEELARALYRWQCDRVVVWSEGLQDD